MTTVLPNVMRQHEHGLWARLIGESPLGTDPYIRLYYEARNLMLTAVIAAQVVEEPDYLKIVKPLILPSLVAIGIGVLMIKYATQIARLVL